MQRVSVSLAAALEERPDVTVTVLALRSSWRFLHLRAVYWLPLALLRIMLLALRGQADVVLFSSMVTASLAVFLRPLLAKHQVKMVAIAHGRDVTLPGVYQRYWVRRILRALNAVLPVSTATAAELRSRGMAEERISIIPNGVTLQRFPQPFISKREPRGTFVLCSVGRLVPRKGFAWFVECVMPLLPAHVHYRIVGSGPDHGTLVAAINRCGLGDRVQLMGRCTDSEIAELYLNSDLLIMPNIPIEGDMEGFGVVILEAGACGTPAIAADMEGMRDVITEGRNGHLCTTADPDAFARLILRYSLNPAALEQLRTSTAGHTTESFSWSRVAETYVALLHSL